MIDWLGPTCERSSSMSRTSGAWQCDGGGRKAANAEADWCLLDWLLPLLLENAATATEPQMRSTMVVVLLCVRVLCEAGS